MAEHRLALAASAIVEGTIHKADAGGVPLAVGRIGGTLFALADRCPHAGGPLSEGFVENGTVRCPWHERHFDPSTGACTDSRATRPATCHRVRVDGDALYVELRSP